MMAARGKKICPPTHVSAARPVLWFARATVILIAAPALGDTLDLSGSTITLRETQKPGALAEVYFDNVNRNGPHDEVTARLSGAGITVGIAFDWNAGAGGADAITVLPPDGIVCDPSCDLLLQEGYAGTVTLYSLETVGM